MGSRKLLLGVSAFVVPTFLPKRFAMGPKNDDAKRASTSKNVDDISAADDQSEPSTSGLGKAPANWEVMYANIQEMRKDKTAAVDTMGCERAHDQKAEPKANNDSPFFVGGAFDILRSP